MNFGYSIKEAVAGFKRARVSTFITILIVSFLLFMITFFSVLMLNVNRIIGVLHANHDLQAFISNTLNRDDIVVMQSKLSEINGVSKVEYISKENAAKEFIAEFGDDIFSILDENPLPASFVITIDNDLTDNQKQIFVKNIEQFDGIDEVIILGGTLNLLVKLSNVSQKLFFILTIFVAFGSLLIVSNTIRLIILERKQIIDTMKLVGATQEFIQRPYIIEGLIQGLFGGLFSSISVFLIIKIVNYNWPGIIFFPFFYYLLIIGAGFLLGFFGSLIAIKRFL